MYSNAIINVHYVNEIDTMVGKMESSSSLLPEKLRTTRMDMLALSTFITRDVIIHCYSSRNKSMHYV